MPFISVSFNEVENSISNISLINDLISSGKLNPIEGKLLRLSINSIPSTSNLDDLKSMCIEIFGNEGDKAFKLLERFVKQDNKRVPWVIFSRTFQEIEIIKKDPFQGFNPRLSTVYTVNLTYNFE